MYRREAALQSQISGHDIRLAPGKKQGWQVAATIDGAEVAAEVEVLVWSDIVRARMHHGILATYWQLLRTAWIYLSTGALWRVLRLRKGPAIAIGYPVFHLLWQLAVALAVGFGLFWGFAALIPGIAGQGTGALAGIAAFVALLRLFKRLDGRLRAHWLIHDYAYASQHRGAHPAELEARMAAFGAEIRDLIRAGLPPRPSAAWLPVAGPDGAHAVFPARRHPPARRPEFSVSAGRGDMDRRHRPRRWLLLCAV